VSAVALVPVLITLVVIPALIVATIRTVSGDRRRNAVWARRWAQAQHHHPFTGSGMWVQIVVRNLVLVKPETSINRTTPDPPPVVVAPPVARPAAARPPVLPAASVPDLDPWLLNWKPAIGPLPAPAPRRPEASE
jgi:hypothetical protein